MDQEDQDYEDEVNTSSDTSADKARQHRKAHKEGMIFREEPSNLRELGAFQLAITCFIYLGCYEFCEQVERVQYHPNLTRHSVTCLRDNKVTIAGVTFIVSPSIISNATGIPNVGEKWYKAQDLDEHYYEPYIKTQFRNDVKGLFAFRFLKDKYVPMMKIILKYFTSEGIFSKLYTYHIRLLMHFTRVWMLNLMYLFFKNIEMMA